MSESYHVGIVSGLLFGVVLGVLVVFLLYRKRVLSCVFDERQELARGVAYKYGFFTLLASVLFYGLLEMVIGRWCDALAGAVLCLVPGICVFAVTCIRKDAYLSLRESPRKVMVLFAFIGLVNVILGGISLAAGELVEEGMVTFRVSNLALGLAILLILGVYLVNRHLGREDGGEDGER